MPNVIQLENFSIVTTDQSLGGQDQSAQAQSAQAQPVQAQTATQSGASGGLARDRAVRADELEMSGVAAEYLTAAGFKGELAQTLLLAPDQANQTQGNQTQAGQTQAGQTSAVSILVGLGDKPLDEPDLRKAAATVFRRAKRTESLVTSLAVESADDLGSAKAVAAVAEAMMLASYRFDDFKSSSASASNPVSSASASNPVSSASASNASANNPVSNEEADLTLRQINVVAPADLDESQAQAALERAAAVANAIALARDLVNRPAGSLTPTQLAAAAVEAMPNSGASTGNPSTGNPSTGNPSTRSTVETETWDKARLEQERCGGILGVNAGSTEQPCLIRMRYAPASSDVPTIYLIGKGITFDTGGLNLKSFDGMQTMKTDMGGAAAVIGAMSAITRLAPNVEVIGICCCTDNQPGPTATKPGDVLRIRNGTTVEVLNTDAEGRLVLADGLSIAAEAQPDLIVDLATLTGACMVALGPSYAGVMSNSDSAVEKLKLSAATAGELMWHLPLPSEYRSQLDSEVADLRNIGKGRYGGALTAGLFLQEFVDSNDWIHLDIAGPVTTDKAAGEFAKGATGFGVRTLVDLVASYS